MSTIHNRSLGCSGISPTDEQYKNPGYPVKRQLANGSWVVRQDGDSIYLAGIGSSPDGDRPFLDRLDLKTLKSERLFRSDKTSYERFLSFTGPDTKTFLTWHQSPTDPPNAFARTLGKSVDAPAGEAVFTSTSVALTHIPDPTPEVRAIKKRLVKYKRADGLDLSFTLYTPPGYQEGTRVPTILYAYPLDYADASKAGQVVGSQETFTQLRQYRLLLLGGLRDHRQRFVPHRRRSEESLRHLSGTARRRCQGRSR